MEYAHMMAHTQIYHNYYIIPDDDEQNHPRGKAPIGLSRVEKIKSVSVRLC
jgi:hypothetical protein